MRKMRKEEEAQALISYGLELFKQKGLTGEVYILEQERNIIGVRCGKVETQETKEMGKLAIRVLRKKTMGFASAADLTKKGILAALKAALASTDYLTPEEHNEFAADSEIIPKIKIYDPAIESISLAEKIRLAKNTEEAALAFDPRIKRIFISRYSDIISRIYLANTQGLTRKALSGLAINHIDLTAEGNGEAENTWGSDFARNPHNLKPERLGRAMAEKAINMLGARSYSTKKTRVVLGPEMTFVLFLNLASAFSAKNALSGKSLFAGKIGEKIASEKVVLIDNGILEGGAASFPFDGEGTACQKTVLIEKGVLRGFLHQIKTAGQMNLKPTGNAIRGYAFQPEIAATNFYLEPGDISQKDLISQVSDGILIHCLMNLHCINAISGDFSLGANGQVIENGKLSYPVRGFTLAGNIIDLFKNIALIANDFQLFFDEDPFSGGAGGGASILIEDISIAGE